MTTGSGTTTYAYDPSNLRYKKTSAAQTVQYQYDASGQVISESNGNNAITVNYIRGDRLLAKKDAATNQIYYYLYNGHGDVVQIVDTNGNVVNQYQYDEWGNIVNQSEAIANSFKYAGEQYDSESGLYYLKARYYDPSVGRFINEDTYEGQINNPLSLNLYTYVENNPLTNTDPTGHFCSSNGWSHKGSCDGGISGAKIYGDITDANGNIVSTYTPDNEVTPGTFIKENGKIVGSFGKASFCDSQCLGVVLGPEADFAGLGSAVGKIGNALGKGWDWVKGVLSKGTVKTVNAISNSSKDLKVIGRLDDTAVAKNWQGYDVLNDPSWTLAKNDEWVNAGIKNKQDFYVASPMTEKNLVSTNPKYPGPTVFAREIEMLNKAGYVQKGDYFINPSNLK
ncbi:MAG: hypothetical protein A2189_00925 [Paenibacillus sp. RIFOXYA1_FULL_44_5]|nr:MAG: hypothetical protein A2189_00925 [Paenibacillus sp. RIFOXYA1_FULL_44_5]